MMRWLPLILGLFWLSPAEAKPLVADVSHHVIEIDTEFKGTELLIFGVRNAPGDIVVAVRGPKQDYRVWQKRRVMGMWANRHAVRMEDAPDFYMTASTRPLEEVAGPALRRQLALGETAGLTPVATGKAVAFEPYVDAFLKERRNQFKYGSLSGIDFMGDSLFKAVMPFPDRIVRGIYTAEVYLIHQGRIQASQVTPLVVRKRGLDARVYDYAHRHPLMYGLLAISLALLAGWGVSSLVSRL